MKIVIIDTSVLVSAVLEVESQELLFSLLLIIRTLSGLYQQTF